MNYIFMDLFRNIRIVFEFMKVKNRQFKTQTMVSRTNRKKTFAAVESR